MASVRPIQVLTQNLNLSKKAQFSDLYPAWEPGKAYKSMEIVKHGVGPDGSPQLFQIMQAHNSQADWLPKVTPALYKGIGFTNAGVPIWVQPQGGHDAYKKNDKVSYNGIIYVSTIDGNVWPPGVYGWTKQ